MKLIECPYVERGTSPVPLFLFPVPTRRRRRPSGPLRIYATAPDLVIPFVVREMLSQLRYVLTQFAPLPLKALAGSIAAGGCRIDRQALPDGRRKCEHGLANRLERRTRQARLETHARRHCTAVGIALHLGTLRDLVVDAGAGGQRPGHGDQHEC